MTIGFGERPALIVVDVINAFTDPEMPLGSDLAAVIGQCRIILDAARAAGTPVFYTTVGYNEGFADAGVWALKQKGVTTLRLGTPAVEIDEREDA